MDHANVLVVRMQRLSQVQVDVVLTSLVTAVHERLHHKVDVLVFNPPYVPTPSEEIGQFSGVLIYTLSRASIHLWESVRWSCSWKRD